MADRSRRSFVVAVLKVSVSVALMAWLLSSVDVASLRARASDASPGWLVAALAVYFANIVASTWRWRLLLDAQNVHVPQGSLLSSYLVAGFFNNFLPSNIGGDVVRIRDTARSAGSKTLATAVVLVDRGLGLMGLVLVAAVGATIVARFRPDGDSPLWPFWLWTAFVLGTMIAAPAIASPDGFARLLRPLRAFHPEWIGTRIETLTGALSRFRDRPAALAACFAGAMAVQGLLVLYYLAVAYALHLPVGVWDLAVIVPVSFLVQMAPVSINGFGVREAAFTFYLTPLGIPIESAVLLPLVATARAILFSLTGGVLYVSRKRFAPHGAVPPTPLQSSDLTGQQSFIGQ
jgi:uncharacterized membrane protein YbhN (UPF0104 family)